NALALSKDETRLFVAEADSNAVAVFDLAAARRNSTLTHARPQGRIPTDWYPTALVEHAGTLLVLCGKGQGTAPNPDGPVPGHPIDHPTGYALGQLNGTLRSVPSRFTQQELAALSRRVAAANNWDAHADAPRRYPPFKHVGYIIKE